MADYIYLMETRLTPAQGRALAIVRDAARAENMTVFLVGGAVRDLTVGTSIRDLDVAVQGPVRTMRKTLEAAGARVTGESDINQSLYLRFPGGVRMEVGATLQITYPKPGKPVAVPATIQEDLRRRDFTANAMAISLNEGSYGLLLDPLNGTADTENRELRLISNYGFIEDPVRMIRAIRLGSRLGWEMEEKTRARYSTGKDEGYISALSKEARGYELEEIFHEEDPLRTLRKLEAENWVASLFPALDSKKANEAEIGRIRDFAGQLESAGIFPDTSAAFFEPLTAKMASADVAALKKMLPQPGYVKQVESLEAEGKAFAAEFMGKGAARPSDAWKMLHAAVPEQVLSLMLSSRSAAAQARIKAFLNEWPTARQRIPYQLMAEMRITPDLPGYADLVETLFYELMNGNLATVETARAFLEPYSPPAPPPPPNLRRRPAKRETKARSRSKKAVALPAGDAVESLPEIAASDDSAAPAAAAPKPAASKPVKKAADVAVPAETPAKSAPAAAKAAAVPAKSAPAKSAPAKAVAELKAPAAKAAPAKAAAKTAPAKAAPAKAKSAPAKAAPAKSAAAAAKPAISKKSAAPSAKKAPAAAKKSAPAKPVKKAAPAAAKKAGSTKAAPSKTPQKPSAKSPAKGKPAKKVARPAASVKKAPPAKAAAKKAPATKPQAKAGRSGGAKPSSVKAAARKPAAPTKAAAKKSAPKKAVKAAAKPAARRR